MKPKRQEVPVRKAVSILVAGMLCGFCAVAAILTFADAHGFSTRGLGLAVGAVLSLAGAILINRYL